MNGPCALVPLVVLLTILILDDLTSFSASFSSQSPTTQTPQFSQFSQFAQFSQFSQDGQDGFKSGFRTSEWAWSWDWRDHSRQLRWSHGSSRYSFGFGARASPLQQHQFSTSEDVEYVDYVDYTEDVEYVQRDSESEMENRTVAVVGSSITQSQPQTVAQPHAYSGSGANRDNVPSPVNQDQDDDSNRISRNQIQTQSRQQWRTSLQNESFPLGQDKDELEDDETFYNEGFGGGSRVPMGWADPRLHGGRMLDFTLPRRGEPLNVIISGLSDPYILTPRGLLHYAQTLGFSSECLGFHIGQLHVANLGDSMGQIVSPPRRSPTGRRRTTATSSSSTSSTSTSTSTAIPTAAAADADIDPSTTANSTLHLPGNNTLPGFPTDPDDDDDEPDISHPPDDIPDAPSGGNKTEQLLARQNFDWPMHGWPDYGTCLESLIGGNHFRAWKQDGAGARTGAWFLAVSWELWAGRHHDIAKDGYNRGRDQLVTRALLPTRWSPTLDGIWWKSEVIYNTTLLKPGKDGINHGIAQDGKVAILTVRRRDSAPSIGELEKAWNPFLNAYQLPNSPNSPNSSNSSNSKWPSWLNLFGRLRRWWKTDDEERALRRRAMWELQEVLKIRQAEQAERIRQEQERRGHRTSWLDWVGLVYRTWLSNQ